jgi:hypothetical protein
MSNKYNFEIVEEEGEVMIVVIEYAERMNVKDFAEKYDLTLRITERTNYIDEQGKIFHIHSVGILYDNFHIFSFFFHYFKVAFI